MEPSRGEPRGRRRAAAALSTVGLFTILGSSYPTGISAFVPTTHVSYQIPLKSQPIRIRDAAGIRAPIFEQKHFSPSRECRVALAKLLSSPSSDLNGVKVVSAPGLTDLGSLDFGRFGSERDPFKDIKPVWLDPEAAWLKECGFAEEIQRIKFRTQGVNFFLVGMPGSGKTTVGKMLAQGLNYRWIDVDQHIEAKLDRTATQVLAEDGEPAWRKQETETLRGLQTFVQTVVSTGGGVMTVRENLPLLHTGLILWLDLTPEAIIERMQESGEIDKRPLLKQASDPVAAVRELYEKRQEGYALSDVRIQLDAEAGPVEVLRKVVSRIHEELDARPPKAQAWDEKRQRMKRMWDIMKDKGQSSSINPVQDSKRSNAAIKAITKFAKAKAKGPFKGFAVKGKSSEPKPTTSAPVPPTAAGDGLQALTQPPSRTTEI